MMTTTAYYRTLAADFESRLEWGRAADAWQRAIDLYPVRRGELAEHDINLLTERRDACLRAYFPE